jgi:hypothetical protein
MENGKPIPYEEAARLLKEKKVIPICQSMISIFLKYAEANTVQTIADTFAANVIGFDGKLSVKLTVPVIRTMASDVNRHILPTPIAHLEFFAKPVEKIDLFVDQDYLARFETKYYTEIYGPYGKIPASYIIGVEIKRSLPSAALERVFAITTEMSELIRESMRHPESVESDES